MLMSDEQPTCARTMKALGKVDNRWSTEVMELGEGCETGD